MNISRLIRFSLALSIAGHTALADPTATTDDSTSSLVLPRGALQLDAALAANLSSNEVFKSVSISPDLWYGASDGVTLGLVHSTTGATGFIGGDTSSICVGSACAHVYPDVGLDARLRLARPLAVDVGLYAVDTNPFELAIKLGVSGRWRWSKLVVELQPSLFVGLTNRQPTQTVGGATVPSGPTNTETLFVPITVGYAIASRCELALQPGLQLPFTATGTTWRIPLAIAARFAATPRLGIGLAFTFLDLAGGDSTTGASQRSLSLGGTYAF